MLNHYHPERICPLTALVLSAPITMFGPALSAGTPSPGNDAIVAQDIPVVVHVVACRPDFLVCRDVDVTDDLFTDMETCRRTWTAERARKAIVGTGPDAEIMVRCRYDPSKATDIAGRRPMG